MDICTPAKFYLFFAVLSFLTAMFYGQSSLFIIVQIIVSVAWVFGLNFLCKSGYMTIAWAITLIPVWISIILYGLTFIPINGTGSTSVNGTYAPVPGDFTILKAATLTDIINSIFRQFTSQAQIAIKPVFDQAKCNAAKTAAVSASTPQLGYAGMGWGAHSYSATDSLGPYYIDVAGDICTASGSGITSCTVGNSAGVLNTLWGGQGNAVTSGGGATGGTMHRPVQQPLWQAQVAACQGGGPTN